MPGNWGICGGEAGVGEAGVAGLGGVAAVGLGRGDVVGDVVVGDVGETGEAGGEVGGEAGVELEVDDVAVVSVEAALFFSGAKLICSASFFASSLSDFEASVRGFSLSLSSPHSGHFQFKELFANFLRSSSV